MGWSIKAIDNDRSIAGKLVANLARFLVTKRVVVEDPAGLPVFDLGDHVDAQVELRFSEEACCVLIHHPHSLPDVAVDQAW